MKRAPEMTNDCGLKQAETGRGGKMYSLEITCGWQGAACRLSLRLNVVMRICVWRIEEMQVKVQTEKQTQVNVHFSPSLLYSNICFTDFQSPLRAG